MPGPDSPNSILLDNLYLAIQEGLSRLGAGIWNVTGTPTFKY